MPSTILGLPSPTLKTVETSRPFFTSSLAVPDVATNLNPNSRRSLAIGIASNLSALFTEINTVPLPGINVPALMDAFLNDSPNVFEIPMTSPVDFISGLRNIDSSGNLLKGSTASLTATYGLLSHSFNSKSFSLTPTAS